jgi:hypothetical protein
MKTTDLPVLAPIVSGVLKADAWHHIIWVSMTSTPWDNLGKKVRASLIKLMPYDIF